MNLSQIKREKMMAFLKKLKEENSGNEENLIALNEIENELNGKKYGLVWEEHEENVDKMMEDNVPVFVEDKKREIKTNEDEYNFLLEGYNLHSIINDYGTKTLLELIEKPLWTYANEFAKDTFIPDIISINNINDKITFLILDAKYYYPIIEKGKIPRGQPGIESVAKQYLYQLAYKDFIIDNNINFIKNYFLFPTENNEIIDKGEVKLDMLHNLGLENIGIKFIPVVMAYDGYLNNKKIDINAS